MQLCAITAYFNPLNFDAPRKNYELFEERLLASGVPLCVVECEIDGDDSRPLQCHANLIRTRGRDLTEARNLPETLVQYRRHNTNMSTVYRARLNETGVDIALREIRAELPDFTISRDEIAELRRVLFETTDGPQKRTLDATRQALQRYIDLKEAFQQKHPTSENR